MPYYRINYESFGQFGSTPLAHEFTADDDQAARKVYDDFKQRLVTANASGRSSKNDFVYGMVRIDQREIVVKIC